MQGFLVTTGSAWVSRLLLAGAQVYTIPILVRTLHTEEYAAHILLAALAPWFLLADLGLGPALQNYVARFFGVTGLNCKFTQQWMDRAAAICSGVALLLVTTSTLTATLLFSNFSELPITDQPKLFSLAALLYICGTLGNVAYKVWYAMGVGWRANIATGLAGIVTLSAIHLLPWFPPEHRLYAAICITVGPQAILGIVAFLLCRFRSDLIEISTLPSVLARATVHKESEKHGIALWKTALQFLGFNVMAAMVLNVDYLLIARLMSPEDIVLYGLITRIFGLFWMFYSTALQALWPICTRLLHAKEYGLTTSAIKRVLGAGFTGLALFFAALVISNETIFNLLTAQKVAAPDLSLLLAFTCYYAIRVWTDTFAMVLQSQNQLNALYWATPVQVLLSVGFQLVLIPNYGLMGALIGLIGSYLLTVSWVLPLNALPLLKFPK
jgi:O-antigen/teichoic acid export membrane protein